MEAVASYTACEIYETRGGKMMMRRRRRKGEYEYQCLYRPNVLLDFVLNYNYLKVFTNISLVVSSSRLGLVISTRAPKSQPGVA